MWISLRQKKVNARPSQSTMNQPFVDNGCEPSEVGDAEAEHEGSEYSHCQGGVIEVESQRVQSVSQANQKSHSQIQSLANVPSSSTHAHYPSDVNATSILHVTDQEDQVKLFNYHEYVIDGPTPSSKVLRVDFPSPYKEQRLKYFQHPDIVQTHLGASRDSSLPFRGIRVCRVPRVYNTAGAADDTPQFSEYFPGREPGALRDDLDDDGQPIAGPEFESLTRPDEIALKHDLTFTPNVQEPINLTTALSECLPANEPGSPDQPNTLSSRSPLEDVLTQQEYQDILLTINAYLRKAYQLDSFCNIVYAVLSFVSGGLLDFLNNTCEDSLCQMDRYIDEQNDQLRSRNLRVVSPRRNAFLSLDFEIIY